MSGGTLFISLFNNLALFVVVVAVYGQIDRWLKLNAPGFRGFGIGVLFSVGALGGMFSAIPISDGAHVDLRNAFIILGGAQGGPLGAIIPALSTGVYRVYLGGAGTTAGLAAIGVSTLAGLVIWRYRLFQRGIAWAFPAAAASSLCLLPTFLLIGTFDLGAELFVRVGLPYGAAVLITLVVVGHLLHRQDRVAEIETQQRRHRQRNRDFAKSASDWFWELGSDYRITFLSANYKPERGQSSRELIGKHFWEMEGGAVEDQPWSHLLSLLQRGEPFRDFEYSHETADGDLRYVRIGAVPVFDGGEFQGYRGSASDITKVKLAEIELEQERSIFRKTIDATPLLIHVRDRDGRVLYANSFAMQRWGVQAEELSGKRIEDVVPLAYRNEEGTEQRDALVMKTKRPIQFFPDTLTFVDGQRRMLISKIPVLDADDEVDFVVTVCVDNTDQEKIKQELRDAVARAEDANRAKSSFLATMSHELRTPLNAIIGFSDLIRGQHFGPIGNPRYVSYANDIHDSGSYLLDLVSDLLNLSAIEAGQHALNIRAINLPDVVTAAVSKLTPSAQTKGLSVTVGSDLDPEDVFADERAVAQIVLNLVSNAIKFTNSGRIEIALEDVEGSDPCSVRLSISDTGVGIPADRLATVSDPFVQVETEPMVAGDGIGLGLSIVRSLVEAHGGMLAIDSIPGQGTTVSVTLPRDARKRREAADGVTAIAK